MEHDVTASHFVMLPIYDINPLHDVTFMLRALPRDVKYSFRVHEKMTKPRLMTSIT